MEKNNQDLQPIRSDRFVTIRLTSFPKIDGRPIVFAWHKDMKNGIPLKSIIVTMAAEQHRIMLSIRDKGKGWMQISDYRLETNELCFRVRIGNPGGDNELKDNEKLVNLTCSIWMRDDFDFDPQLLGVAQMRAKLVSTKSQHHSLVAAVHQDTPPLSGRRSSHLQMKAEKDSPVARSQTEKERSSKRPKSENDEIHFNHFNNIILPQSQQFNSAMPSRTFMPNFDLAFDPRFAMDPRILLLQGFNHQQYQIPFLGPNSIPLQQSNQMQQQQPFVVPPNSGSATVFDEVTGWLSEDGHTTSSD